MPETMSDRIKLQRKKLCSSTKEFEAKYGISSSNMSKWESDAHNMRIDNLIKLSDIFGCTADYLICGESQETHEYSRYYDELGLEPLTVEHLKTSKNINNWPDFTRVFFHANTPSLVEELTSVREEMKELLEKVEDFQDLSVRYANFLLTYPFEETDLIYWEAEYNRKKSAISDTFKKHSSKVLFEEKLKIFEQSISRSIDYLDDELYERDLDILSSIYLTAISNDGEDRGLSIEATLTIEETLMIQELLHVMEKVYLERYNFNDAIRRRTQHFLKENSEYFSEFLALRGKYNDLRLKCDVLSEKYFNDLEKRIQKASWAEMLIMPSILGIIMDAEEPLQRIKLLSDTILTSTNSKFVNELAKDYLNLPSGEVKRYKAFWEDCLNYYENKTRSSFGGTEQYELLKDNALIELANKGLKEILIYEKEK